ncbi:MAG: efflux RND transporter periplasmic adaptor subunit [Bacteroidetes bacterium]|nr:MAG: efflux RND transporter periplasmic adaptor subunit [Bacteroidota bacterium]REK00700.1 MAG: efflux RND transporter periplasmic adaptor subunit [Bacteroidota bacterium]REK35178.1 MAG: efflux RND transporter periplasmic adaptor subunit [Bacteroidota bacterium]REK48255.1 MAG: efflux RND transporter periplasmic adaptor subunit [Bacteroidota bacterium]
MTMTTNMRINRSWFKISILALLIHAVFCLPACKNIHEDDHGHSHDEEPITKLTLHSESTELYVEFIPLVKNEKSVFLVHVSQKKENQLALERGKMTLSLIKGQKGIRYNADSLRSPGIFQCSLIPSDTGDSFKLVFNINDGKKDEVFEVENVTVYSDRATANASILPEEASDIHFSKEQAWRTEFAVQKVKRSKFSEVIKTSGVLLPHPSDATYITASARGIISFAGPDILNGKKTVKGELLFRIGSGNISGDNVSTEYEEIRTRFEMAEAEYKRNTSLIKDKIISQKTYEQSKTEYELTKKRFETVSSGHSSNERFVRSPASGFLSEIYIQEGQFAEAGDRLAKVVGGNKLLIQANLSQKDFAKSSSIVSANFKTPDMKEFTNSKDFNGKVIGYARSISEHRHVIPVYIEIENNTSLIPGSALEVNLITTSEEEFIAVPVNSVIEEQGYHYVFVQKSGERYEKREVRTGKGDGIKVPVLSGLAEGEIVVIRGAYQVKMSAVSGAIPDHGHSH